AAAFVSLSDFEGRPNAVMEAMAAGAPLIVSDIAAHREFLDETCALFVPPRDDAAVALALAAVLDDPASAAALAKEARRRIAACSVHAMTGSFEALYRALIATEAKRGLVASRDY
ncbi:MAG TPA: glycosyltransferase, partial [Thermoanaerobaculia bacterium]|nr:glycosyltransferase [Thermoanaerobaculia bacterium]